MAEQKSRELGAKEGKVGFGHNRWLKSRKVCGSRGGQAPSYLRRPQLVFECPQDEAEKTCVVVSRVMSGAAEPAVALSVPLNVDARAGPNWDEAH